MIRPSVYLCAGGLFYIKERKQNMIFTMDKFPHIAAGKSYIPITVCALALVIIGIAAYAGYFRVKIYNFDGFGGWFYLGSTFLRSSAASEKQDACGQSGAAYRIRLPRRAAWNAVTDIYQLRPGSAFLLFHKGEKAWAENPRNHKTAQVILEKKVKCRFC